MIFDIRRGGVSPPANVKQHTRQGSPPYDFGVNERDSVAMKSFRGYAIVFFEFDFYSIPLINPASASANSLTGRAEVLMQRS